jgi:thiol-disulfide isomerase/thioredoxin
MSTTKKILFVAVLALVVGAIWYLQSLKVQPGGGAGNSESIAVSSENGTTTTVSTSNGTTATTTENGASVAAALQALAVADQKAGYLPAKEIVDPTGFVNASSGFTLGSLIGKKVILLDFWTYSCINCIRTIPHVNAWEQAYASSGLEIVGMHTPEFDFEKQITNVQAAVKQYGIQYPVILDSNYGTWDAYNNLYWPADYLIDMAGYVVHQGIGEGNYDETESEIQSLLKQRATILGLPEPQFSGMAPVAISQVPSSGLGSPETYFGAARNQYLADGTPQTPGVQTLAPPQNPTLNSLYLGGTWNFENQYATNVDAGAKVVYEYQAAKVFFVAASASGASTTVQVLQDGKPLPAADSGSDVVNGILTVGQSRLYNVVANPDGSGIHTLEFIITSPGLQAYTFTFG